MSPVITRIQSFQKKTSSETHTSGKLEKLATLVVQYKSPYSSYYIQNPILKQALVNPSTVTNPQVLLLIVPTIFVVPSKFVSMEMLWKPETPLRLAQPLHGIPMESPN